MLDARTGHLSAPPIRASAPFPPLAHAAGTRLRRVEHRADPTVRREPEGFGADAPTPGAALPQPPAVPWREIGRAEPDDALWITWVAFLGAGGDVLYRSLVVADGAIAVAVELEPWLGNGTTRAIHRGRCGLPPADDAYGFEGRAALLLAAADKAVARFVAASGPVDGQPSPTLAAERNRAA